MSPDRLGTALHDLVDDVEDGLARPSPTSCGPAGVAAAAQPARPGRGGGLRRRAGGRRALARRRPPGLGARRDGSTTAATAG